jgi:hypothetical protein
MSFWKIAILITPTWLLWAVGGILAIAADKAEGKRQADAGFSIAPIIPMLQLVALGFAVLLNALIAPWGTRIVGTVHALLLATFLIGITREIWRIRRPSRPAS